MGGVNDFYIYNWFHCTEVRRVVDGDTLDMTVDLGFRLTTVQRFRLANYNAPESRGNERRLGLLATRDLEGRISCANQIVVQTGKAGSFGRWICHLYLDEVSVVPQLIREGYGVAWDGRGRRPSFNPKGIYPLEVQDEQEEGFVG